MPEEKWGTKWRVVIDTFNVEDAVFDEDEGAVYEAGATVMVQPWSLLLLLRTGWRPKPRS
jgi:hypothetical protein